MAARVAPRVVPYEKPAQQRQRGVFRPAKHKDGPTPVPQQPIRVHGLCHPHHIPGDKSGADELGRGVSIALLLTDAAVDPASFPQPT